MTFGRVLLLPDEIMACEEDMFLYGWTQPLLCAAGVVHGRTLTEMEANLTSIYTPERWSLVRSRCGSLPVVFGRCRNAVDLRKDNTVKVEILGGTDRTSEYSVVRYRRPNLRQLEIYTLEFRVYHQPAVGPTAHRIDQFDFTAPSRPSSSLDPTVLEQFNYGTHLNQQLQERFFSTPSLSLTRQFSSVLLAQGSRAITHIQGFSRYLCTRVPDFVGRAIRYSAARNVLILDTRNMLNEMSACLHQLDVRLEQAVFLPRELPRPIPPPASCQYISRYVNFWNNVWLVLNDITIGLAFRTFLCENHIHLARMLTDPLKFALVELPQRALLWLNNWPAGLKLNTELSQFYCHSLLGVVVIWSRVLERILLPSLPTLIFLTGAVGVCGLTMSISILSDLLSFFSVHLLVCYRASAFVFSHQLAVISSLWNLFRGKRYNILRNRKDAWDYDLDQLLLGTMLFTLVAFLSPTILTYYAFFATARFVLIVVHAGLDTILVLMNHFPLFALLLRAKSPLRIPGGLVFKFGSAGAPPIIEMKPIAISHIFDHYAGLGASLWSHYHPLRLFRAILRGDTLTTIPRPLIRLPSVQGNLDSKVVG